METSVTIPDDVLAELDALAAKRHSSRDAMLTLAAKLLIRHDDVYRDPTPEEIADAKAASAFMTEASRRVFKNVEWE